MPIIHFLLALAVIAVWGFNFVVIKVGLQEMPPLFLCFARFFLTSVPWVFFVKRPAAPIRMIVSYGLVMFTLQFSLLFVGIYAGVTAGLASILLQLQAFFSILLAIAFLGERLHKWQVIGAAVSFTGIALIALNIGGEVTWPGLLLVISAAVFWGAGSVISKKMGKVNMAALVIWSSLVAWPPLLAISFFFEGDKILYFVHHFTWPPVGAVLYITFLSTLFGFGTWNWLLRCHSISKISPFTLLVPIIGMLSSAYFLGEPLPSWKIGAGVIVICGLCINLLGPMLFEKRGGAELKVPD